MGFKCLTEEYATSAFAMCLPDYGLDCRPDGDCDPEDGAEDPY